MYIKDINKLRRQMKKHFEEMTNGIIDSLIANEQAAISANQDASIVFEPVRFKTDIRLFVKPPADAEFEIGNICAIDLK